MNSAKAPRPDPGAMFDRLLDSMVNGQAQEARAASLPEMQRDKPVMPEVQPCNGEA
jgi:hypothetical protein